MTQVNHITGGGGGVFLKRKTRTGLGARLQRDDEKPSSDSIGRGRSQVGDHGIFVFEGASPLSNNFAFLNNNKSWGGAHFVGIVYGLVVGVAGIDLYDGETFCVLSCYLVN